MFRPAREFLEYVVDAADFDEWRNNLGKTGDNLSADGNRDGLIDAADYVVWRHDLGNSLPGGAGGANAFVPEPTTIRFGWLAFTGCLSLRARRF